jgi:hypothetical protein
MTRLRDAVLAVFEPIRLGQRKYGVHTWGYVLEFYHTYTPINYSSFCGFLLVGLQVKLCTGYGVCL